MPELPEVEATRRAIAPALVGRRIVDVEVARARMLRRQPDPVAFRPRMVGRIVRSLDRHGKFLLARLTNGLTWVTHLGMSGRVALGAVGSPRDPHTNVVVRVGGGTEFRLVDPRTFGFVAVLTDYEAAESPLSQLGPDAMDDLPTAASLGAALANRTAAIKSLLLDQRILAGVGNIYADEALHSAAISPHRQGGSISPDEIAALRVSIRATLRSGLRLGGTSLADLAYLLPDGRSGAFGGELRAYGRSGDVCLRCGAVVRRDVIRGRSAFWCAGCQV